MYRDPKSGSPKAQLDGVSSVAIVPICLPSAEEVQRARVWLFPKGGLREIDAPLLPTCHVFRRIQPLPLPAPGQTSHFALLIGAGHPPRMTLAGVKAPLRVESIAGSPV